MTKISLVSVGAALSALMVASAAHAFPAFGADSGPGIIITFGPGGAISTTATGQGPYDGIEDTYVGVVNNSSHTVTGINLSGSNIFGFEVDGIDTYGAVENVGNPDTTGYGGPNGWFTHSDNNTGTVHFLGGIAPGGSDYFSLEESVSVSKLGVPEPATWALMMIGVAGLGVALRRRTAAVAA